MAKNFAPRISKRERETIDITDRLANRDIFRISDEKLLRGARLDEIELKEIVVKEQVRTKFNEASLRELAENIKVNGLIQPLVLHVKNGVHTLICGERRFRAMSLIKMKSAPCFVLENKTEQELMAIQFSENSAREALHYIDKADGILNYQNATKASERKIQQALGISKSEVHRSLLIAKMSPELKEAAKSHNIEKYVLVEYDSLPESATKEKIEQMILDGKVNKRSQLARAIKEGGVVTVGKRNENALSLPRGVSASAFLKAMDARTKELDPETRLLLQSLVQETKEMMDN